MHFLNLAWFECDLSGVARAACVLSEPASVTHQFFSNAPKEVGEKSDQLLSLHFTAFLAGMHNFWAGVFQNNAVQNTRVSCGKNARADWA